MKSHWFEVDKSGLGRQAEEQGKGRLVGELVQNALDEPGVTQIAVTLTQVPSESVADLTVEDDAPEGFKDLTHAWTLFAPSASNFPSALKERIQPCSPVCSWVKASSPVSAFQKRTGPPMVTWPARGIATVAIQRPSGLNATCSPAPFNWNSSPPLEL